MKGDGGVYKRGKKWWIFYSLDGRQRYEPGGRTKAEAKEKLKLVHVQQREGTFIPPSQRKATVNELLNDLEVALKLKGLRSLAKAKSHANALRKGLGKRKAVDINSASIRRYQDDRLKAGKAPATVNRECELLRQAFKLAAEDGKAMRVPTVPKLTEDNARQGFVSPQDFQALLAKVPDEDVRDFIEWSGITGTRPNETRQLTWSMVEDGVLRIPPQVAKTRTGRSFALAGTLKELIERRRKRRRFDTPLIFHRVSKGQPGQPVRDYIKMFRAAAKELGLPATLRPYDLRRSAVRNLVRAGVDPAVAMKISGHKTRSTFDRYNITDEADTAAAFTKVADLLQTYDKPGRKRG